MSGIEIIGLVLGAIPLFISAAEHYRDGTNFLKRAVKRRRFIAKYRDELREQHVMLLMYLKTIVGRSHLSPKVQASLIDAPNGNAWQALPVTRALERELGCAYEPFVDLLTRICTNLAKQIQFDDASKSTTASDEQLLQKLQSLCLASVEDGCHGAGGRSAIWDRITFSWKHSERLTMLDELKAQNKSLQKLINAAEQAKPYERQQASRRAHATFELRDETERLYEVLCKACKCQPFARRVIGLGLAVHHFQRERDNHLNFDIAVYDAQNNGHTIPVKMIRLSDTDASSPPPKQVQIGLTKSQRRPANPFEQMKGLHDICGIHQLAQKRGCDLQMVVDHNGDLFSSQKNPSGPCQISHQSSVSETMLTLCDVMKNLELYSRKRWLHREKAILAVILSYSVLQVHQSSWWQSSWNSESISFPGLHLSVSHTINSLDQQVKLRRPFTRSVVVAGGTGGAGKCKDRGDVTQSSPAAMPHQDGHLHALGTILIELYLNRSIKDKVSTTGGCLNYRRAAQDLLEEHADDIDMTPEYLKAVTFCLNPHPDPCSGSRSFKDEGFREFFYSEVISPLENDLCSRFEIGDKIWTQGSE